MHIYAQACISVYINKYTPSHTYIHYKVPPPRSKKVPNCHFTKWQWQLSTLQHQGDETYTYIYEHAHTYIYTRIYTHIHIITCTYMRTYNTMIITSIWTNITSRYVALNYIPVNKKTLQYNIRLGRLYVYSLHLILDWQLFIVEAIVYWTQFLTKSCRTLILHKYNFLFHNDEHFPEIPMIENKKVIGYDIFKI